MFEFKRVLSHLCTGRAQVRRAFPAATLATIEAAIRGCEATHGGQLRFAVEGGLDGWPLLRGLRPRERALQVFAELGVWDTEHNNGVLLYLLLADRDVEIVADRGIGARVPQAEWEAICRRMESEFRAGRFEAGALAGIDEIGRLLARHFPARGVAPNELDDRPALL
ncbi:MAG: TPM domain-containing protein [Gammaproteobacteria bacterium]|nr:TPM domain-containing protein [Gammaproteobacteria bacterium]